MPRFQGAPRRRRAALWLCLVGAVVVAGVSLAGAGCRDALPPSAYAQPGLSPCVYWVWDGFDLRASLKPAAPMTVQWPEFLDASREYRVLIYDFQFMEGHPEAVEATWNDVAPPKVTLKPWVSYRSAGRWSATSEHFTPNSLSLFFLHLPEGGRIDNADEEAWRYPVGTEIVQLIYRRDTSNAAASAAQGQRAVLVEWRLMRMAGPQRGQLRTDGTRSDWVYESAVRDPANRVWRRTREDGRDVRWTKMGRGGNRFVWPVVRPHTCAECHRLAGRSPLDGPRGGHEVYTIGDLREVAWTEQTEQFAPWMAQPPSEAAIAAARRQTLPPERAERFEAYIRDLAEQRRQDPALVRAQQRLIDASPFAAGDPPTVARGKEIYQTQCAACHGAEARGNGPLALRDPQPPAIVGRKDKQLIKALRYGRDNMPAFGATLPGDEQWRLVEYLRTLPK
ncbi:MAG: cytochrome c [Planctomycetes bacterium]|nr:cytochrome c [Planctomycetota bacterium]